MKVLIVEDSQNDIDFYSRQLSDCDVFIANNLKEGRLALSAQQFDLIILDNGLPDGMSVDHLDSITSLSEEAFIVMVSGAVNAEIVKKALGFGVSTVRKKGSLGNDSIKKIVTCIKSGKQACGDLVCQA